MDPETYRAILRRALVALNQERGVTIVISSHVLDQLMRVCTRFGVIAAGRMVREFSDEELHAACGSSVRVKTADPARALALLEERLPWATFRVEPDQAIVIGGSPRHAAASFGGSASDAAASGAPSVEEVSHVLHDAPRSYSSSPHSSVTSRTTLSSSWTRMPSGRRWTLACSISLWTPQRAVH